MLTLASPWASALGLGRLSVQSALGEALQAEIEVTSMTAEEQANLRIRVAPPEAYRAANVDYNPVLPSTRATLQKRPDGRLFVRLVSDRGVQEPFVDVILEISWATGRLVREYTLLFDPPAAQRAPAAQASSGTTTAPVISGAPPAPTPLPPAPRPRPRRASSAKPPRASSARRATRSAKPRASAAKQRTAASAPRPADEPGQSARAAGAGGDEYRVQSGDSLSKIAGRTQRPGVSLDQMLVSLFRANPQRLHRRQHEPAEGRRRPVGAVGRSRAGRHRRPRRARSSSRRAPTSAPTGSGCAGATLAPQRRAEHAPGERQGPGLGRRPARPPAAPTPDKLTLSKGGADRQARQRRGHARQGDASSRPQTRASPS